jgi:hypothetical protein
VTIEDQFLERLARVKTQIATVGFETYKHEFVERVSREIDESRGPEFTRRRVHVRRDRARDRARVREMKEKILSGEITLRQRSPDVRPTWKYKLLVTAKKAEPSEWTFRKADRVIHHQAAASFSHRCACGEKATRFVLGKFDSKVWVCAKCFTLSATSF